MQEEGIIKLEKILRREFIIDMDGLEKKLRGEMDNELDAMDDKIEKSNLMVDTSLNENDELRDDLKLMKRRVEAQEKEIEDLRTRLTKAEELIGGIRNPDPAPGGIFFFFN